MFAFCLAIALQTPSLPAEEQTAVVQFEKQFGKGLLRVDREGQVRGVCFGFHKSINEADLDILARFEELEAIDCGVSGVTRGIPAVSESLEKTEVNASLECTEVSRETPCAPSRYPEPRICQPGRLFYHLGCGRGPRCRIAETETVGLVLLESY